MDMLKINFPQHICGKTIKGPFIAATHAITAYGVSYTEQLLHYLP